MSELGKVDARLSPSLILLFLPLFLSFAADLIGQMTPDEAKWRAVHLLDLIASPLAASVYGTHPNTLGSLLVDDKAILIPQEWNDWWQWSGKRENAWRTLVKFGTSPIGLPSDAGNPVNGQTDSSSPPKDLVRLLSDARTLSLPRQPDTELTLRGDLSISRTGMSAKKYHEVSRMTSLVLDLLDTLREQHHTEVRHVVDIGAGQVR